MTAMPTINEGVTSNGASEAQAGNNIVNLDLHAISGTETCDISLQKVMEEFVGNWLQALDHKDKKSVATLLFCSSKRTFLH